MVRIADGVVPLTVKDVISRLENRSARYLEFDSSGPAESNAAAGSFRPPLNERALVFIPETSLVCGLFLGEVAQAAALDEAVEVFREVCCVVARAFKGLGHQEYLETRRLSLRNGLCEVFLE